MSKVVEFLLNNYIILFSMYVLLFIILVIVFLKANRELNGNFHEANVFRRLKRIYQEYDYPYIKEIILPINKESYAYYDAIVFGNKYIYILEIKNHSGKVLIDPLDDWLYYDRKKKKHAFMNPFYELELKKHILNRYLDLERSRVIEVVVFNNDMKPYGKKGNNHLIAANQIKSLLKHYETKENITAMGPDVIEEKGNYILEINVSKKSIRKQVVSDLKNQRSKR